MISSSSFGDYLRKSRLEAGLSQESIAADLCLSQNAYCLIENGRTQLTLERMDELARLFETDIETFFLGYLQYIGYKSHA